MIYFNNSVSSRVLISCLDYAKKKNVDVAELINKYSYSIETINDTYNWIDEGLFIDLIKHIENKLSIKNLAFEVGQFSALNPSWGELSNVFKAIGSIKTIVFQFDKFYTYFFKKKNYSIVNKDEYSITINHKDIADFDTYSFNFILGSLSSLPVLWGGEEICLSKLSTDTVKISFEDTPSLFTINKSLNNYSPRLIEDIISSLEKSNLMVEEKNKELQTAYVRLKNSFNDMLISEKMGTLGFLSAGIAHEINNPLSFIISNFRTLQKYFNKLTEFLPNIETNENIKAILVDTPKLFDETNEGLERVKKLVSDINYLAHPGTSNFIPCSIEKIINSAITLTKNLHQKKIKINTSYKHKNLLECIPSSISQVLVNMFINSIQSIFENQTPDGQIDITTVEDEKNLYITISDNGRGIEDKNQNVIFEPFFTTKKPGVGTGLGLSTSLSIIKNHNGSIELVKRRQGASFKIIIPLKQNKNQSNLFE